MEENPGLKPVLLWTLFRGLKAPAPSQKTVQVAAMRVWVVAMRVQVAAMRVWVTAKTVQVIPVASKRALGASLRFVRQGASQGSWLGGAA